MKKIISPILCFLFAGMLYGYGDLNESLEGNFCQNFCKDANPADLSGTRLPGASLSGNDYSCVNFSDADLKGVNFNNSQLICTNFSNADLSNASLSDANLLGANLTGTILDHTRAQSALLKDVPLNGVSHAITLNSNGIQGLYFHGDNLKNGDINNNLILITLPE